MHIDLELIKDFITRWCLGTNTIHTYYGKLQVSLWEVDQLTGLPIVRDMYDELLK